MAFSGIGAHHGFYVRPDGFQNQIKIRPVSAAITQSDGDRSHGGPHRTKYRTKYHSRESVRLRDRKRNGDGSAVSYRRRTCH